MTASVVADQQRLFIGTYTEGSNSQGIYTCRFDGDSGQLGEPDLAAVTVNPSFLTLHPTQPLLYCVNEVDDFEGSAQGAVSAFELDLDTGRLSFVNQQPSLGGAPCHLVVDNTGKFVLVANYLGGNAIVLPVATSGRLAAASCQVQLEGSGPDAARQQAPHAHSVNLSRDNRTAYVADLGTDRIWTYEFNPQQGLLANSSPAYAVGAPGGGPRHLAIHPSGLLAWSNNEMTATVMTFERNPANGVLRLSDEASTLPADYSGRRSTSECLVHPNGKFVYVGNRGHDSIAVFAVHTNGQLKRLQIQNTLGKEPRNFFVMPDGRWLLAANQNSNSIVVFRIEPDGTLYASDSMIHVESPVCIRSIAIN